MNATQRAPGLEAGSAGEARTLSRGSLMAVVLPPMAGLALVAAFLAAEAAGASPLSHVEATVSEAVASGSAARALELMRAGQDPNQPSLIPAGVLDSRPYTVVAIDAAILGRRPELIPILQEHGARIANPAQSACLANAEDLPEVLPMIGSGVAHVDRDPSVDVSDAIGACLGAAK